MEHEFSEGQHSHFYGEVHSVTVHNTMHNHYQGEHDNTGDEATGLRDLHIHGGSHTINIFERNQEGPTTGGQGMRIDFDKKPIPQLEATQRVKVPCSSELVGMLDTIGRMLNTETPELCYRYIVEGVQRDVGHVFGDSRTWTSR